MAGPTGDEVALGEVLADGLGALADWAAALPLEPEHRRKLNSATRSLASTRAHLAEVRRRQAAQSDL